MNSTGLTPTVTELKAKLDENVERLRGAVVGGPTLAQAQKIFDLRQNPQYYERVRPDDVTLGGITVEDLLAIVRQRDLPPMMNDLSINRTQKPRSQDEILLSMSRPSIKVSRVAPGSLPTKFKTSEDAQRLYHAHVWSAIEEPVSLRRSDRSAVNENEVREMMKDALKALSSLHYAYDLCGDAGRFAREAGEDAYKWYTESGSSGNGTTPDLVLREYGQSNDQGVLSVELKTFVMFVSHLVDLDGVVTVGQMEVPVPIKDLRARVDETLRLAQKPPKDWPADGEEPKLSTAESIWLQVFNQLVRLHTSFGVFGCPEVFYLVERTNQSAMSVEGPYVRPTFFKQLAQWRERASSTPESTPVAGRSSTPGGKKITPRAGRSSGSSLTPNPPKAPTDEWLEPLVGTVEQPRNEGSTADILDFVVQAAACWTAGAYKKQVEIADCCAAADAHTMSEPHRSRTSRQTWRWFRSQISSLWLLQWWGEHQLVHARAVKFRSISGYVNEPVVRKGNAIGVKWTMLDIFFFCVSWFLSAICGYVPVLQVCRYAGRGSTATVYRGHYCGFRFVVKKPVEGEVAWREWRGLVARLPNDLAALSQLPIPRYYGLFGGELDNMIVMSDCGSPISPLALDEEMRAKLEDAIAEVEAAGLSPTDVSFNNAVVQGDRVTIVDFADDDAL